MITTGVVGQRWRASITAWGRIEPWDGSPSLDWYVAADDRWHVPRNEPAVRQSRVDGTPVTATRVRVPGGDVVQTIYSCADAGGITVVEVANDSALPVAIAFDRGDVLTERPVADVPIEGIDLPEGSVVMPVGHRARIRVGLAHDRYGAGGLPGRLPSASQVARGWVVFAERPSRLVVPGAEAARVTAARCELVLAGVVDPAEDPAAFLVGAGDLVRLGEVPASGLVDDIAFAVEALGGDARWEAAVALAAAARIVASAGEDRALRDVARIIAGRSDAPTPSSIPEGLFAVPWLESRFAIGGVLFPAGMPTEWLGESIEAHGIPTGVASSVSIAVRWHGARPAVLWEQAGVPVRLTSPMLAAAWGSIEPSGEALWPAAR